MQSNGSFSVHGQYIKDFSFENPNAPFSFQIQEEPTFDVSIDLAIRPLENNFYELVLSILVKAKLETQEGALYIVSLDFGGLFNVEAESKEEVEKILLVHCASMLYPYARRVVSDAIRDGGYPPLSLNPVDFMSLYIEKQQQLREQDNSASAVN